MPLNFFYAAHTYADCWVNYDQAARALLGYGRTIEPEVAEACEGLRLFATSYGVIRNLRLSENEGIRLSPVWDLLRTISPPANKDEVVGQVDDFMAYLHRRYGQQVLSAASKFLWVRFGSPVVIYDSLAWEWMCHHGSCPAGGSYVDFYSSWKAMYAVHRVEIEQICRELPAQSKFICPDESLRAEFEFATSSEWFAERVFDHAIVNAALAERLVRASSGLLKLPVSAAD